MQQIAKVQLKTVKKYDGYTVIDSSGLLIGVRGTPTKADDLSRQHPGSQVKLDQYTEAQLDEVRKREEERNSYPPNEPGSGVRSITPNEIKGDDRLHFMSQPEIDALFRARRLRDLRLAR